MTVSGSIWFIGTNRSLAPSPDDFGFSPLPSAWTCRSGRPDHGALTPALQGPCDRRRDTGPARSRLLEWCDENAIRPPRQQPAEIGLAHGQGKAAHVVTITG